LGASNVEYYSLALDESADAGDTVQLGNFIREVDEDLNVAEKMVPLIPIKGTTKFSESFKGLIGSFNQLGVNLADLSDVITDGAPAVVGRLEKLVKLMQEETTKSGNNSVMVYHCLMQQ
jgi:hypothetical protein